MVPHAKQIYLFYIAEFIYCGKVLIDDETLQEQKIRNNSTIHVLQKKSLPVFRDMTLTEAEIVAAHEDFNDIADPELFCVRPRANNVSANNTTLSLGLVFSLIQYCQSP